MSGEPATPRPGFQRIVELDGLRAICVVLVIVTHLVANGHIFTSNGFWLMGGPFGVQVFFAISGFIITRMQVEEHGRAGRVRLGAFYVRRFFRIIPAYWFYLLVIVALGLMGEVTFSTNVLVRSVLFLTDLQWFPLREFWFTGHSWSLSVEEQYYLVLPCLLWVVLRGSHRAMITAIALLYVFCAYANRVGHLHLPVDLAFLLDFRFILAGVLLALGWNRVKRELARIPGWAIVIVLVLLLGLELAMSSHPRLSLLESPLEPFVVAGLVGWIAAHRLSLGALRWMPMLWLGRCSYSLYLWQELFTGPDGFYGPVKLAAPWLGLPLLIVCAAASYYLIEMPGNAFGHRLSRRMTAE